MSFSKYTIIGGGITGLASAFRLTELRRDAAEDAEKALLPDEMKGKSFTDHHSIALFEGTSRLGGVIGTEYPDQCVIEQGADMFITNKPAMLGLCQRLDLSEKLIPTDNTFRKALILKHGKPIDIPEGFQLLVPTKLWKVLTSPVLSWKGKWRLFREQWIPPKEQTDDESLADFVRRRCGTEVLERLVQPLVGGIYTSDPEKLSLQATMPRFLEMEQEHGSLIKAGLALRKQNEKEASQSSSASGARYGLFLALRNGMSQLLSRLEEAIEQEVSLCKNQIATQLERLPNQNRFRIHFQNGKTHETEQLLLAIPAWQAALLLQKVEDSLAHQLNTIEYASSAIALSFHDLDTIDHPMDAFGLVIPHVENRQILAVSFASQKFPKRVPAGKILLRTFIGGAMQPELLEHSDEELKQIVTTELQEIFGVRQPAEWMELKRYHLAMPQYHVGHVQLVSSIMQQVESIPGLHLAGNGYYGVGLPDCVQGGEQAAENIWKQSTTTKQTTQ